MANSCLSAGVAQLVEQRIRNAKVAGSTPVSGTNFSDVPFNLGCIIAMQWQNHLTGASAQLFLWPSYLGGDTPMEPSSCRSSLTLHSRFER